MPYIGMPNLKKSFHEKGVFNWLEVVFVKQCKGEKCEEIGSIFRNTYLKNYWIDFLQIWYIVLHIYTEQSVCEFDRHEGLKIVS